MSNLTDEFAAVIAELASELGQGLTATLLQRTGTYDPDTQSYAESDVTEHSFACSPPAEDRGTIPGTSEVRRGILRMIVPTTSNLGETIVPTLSDRIQVGSAIYQIVGVAALRVGDGIAGYDCEVRS